MTLAVRWERVLYERLQWQMKVRGLGAGDETKAGTAGHGPWPLHGPIRSRCFFYFIWGC